MLTQDLHAVNNITGRATNKRHLKDGGISKSEVQTLLPDIHTKRLQQIQMYFNAMLKDGVVTYGEFIRFMRLVEVSRQEVESGIKLQKMAKTGVAVPIKGKSKSPILPVPGGIDIDF